MAVLCSPRRHALAGCFTMLLGVATAFVGTATAALDPAAPSNSYGNVGLLQTPTARFNGEGQLRLGFSSARPYDVTFLSAQPYDWLEATFRYTTFRYGGLDGTFVREGYLDKSFDVKFRLLEEGSRTPGVAVGIQDLAGTGLLASEFLVANKRIGSLDVSLGLGWGRLGARGRISNPFASISSTFEERETVDGEVGDFEFGRMFSGDEISVFGGVRWAPIGSRWSIMVEGDGNDYQSEPFGNDLDADWPINLGIGYQASAYGLRVGYERGDRLVFNVYAAADLSQPGPAKVLDPPPTPVAPPGSAITYTPEPVGGLRDENTSQFDAREQDIRDALNRQAIQLIRLEVDEGGDRVTAWVSDVMYRSSARSIGRVARTLSMLGPEEATRVRVISVRNGLEQTRVTLHRQDVRLAASRLVSPAYPLKWANFELASLEPVEDDPALPDSFWDIDWYMGPRYRQSLGDPDESYRGQLFWQFGATKRWSPYLTASAVAEVSVIGNLDDIERESDSTLPRVRSDIANYYREGEHGLRRLEANYIVPLTPEVFARASAGIFEEMYGGVAAEILYRPFATHWAIGANVNRVRQRDFDQRLSFREYEVTTGHMTLYHRFYPLSIQSEISVGRYLAGDYGGTVAMARVFNSGTRIGVFATKTDVSSEEFGEGSFDKGFFISIPFDTFSPRSSTSVANFSFRPLTRDGGQKVRDGQSLHAVTSDRDFLRIVRHRTDLLD